MIGQTISHYRIEEKLGEGGMGVVYRARDLNLNRFAAVKVISSEIADEEHRLRFQLEAESASSLNHPHILTVYEAGTVDGRQYLITEFIDGGTLREWLRREKPSIGQIVDLCAGIADALACAHQAGILHRDVKPENVLVSKQGYAKLVDFGLAKILETEDGPGYRIMSRGNPKSLNSRCRRLERSFPASDRIIFYTFPRRAPATDSGNPRMEAWPNCGKEAPEQ